MWKKDQGLSLGTSDVKKSERRGEEKLAYKVENELSVRWEEEEYAESWKASEESQKNLLILASPRSPSNSSFSYSFNKHGSLAYCMPGTTLGERSPGPGGQFTVCILRQGETES